MRNPVEPLAITAYTQTNALGRGNAASLSALQNGRSGLRRCDLEHAPLDTWIGRVEGLESSNLPDALVRFDCRNHRLAEAALLEDGFLDKVNAAKAHHGAHRIGLFVGTSTSGIGHTEDCYRRHLSEGTQELGQDLRYPFTHAHSSLAMFCRSRLDLAGPALVVSTACSSSAKVFATAHRYISAGFCDAAVVGGVDSLCATTLYGFKGLDLISAQPCRPWDAHRNGINIGEGAGFALLERPADAYQGALLLGYGESSDAYHASAPHPQGEGAFRAMRAALGSAGLRPKDIDYINLHGTATPANDRAEDTAVIRLFGEGIKASSTKGWTGHTLGAAGVTEAIFCLHSLDCGFLPETLNTRVFDERLRLRVLLQTAHEAPRRVMSNAFGFGGSNCALVFGINR